MALMARMIPRKICEPIERPRNGVTSGLVRALSAAKNFLARQYFRRRK
jgi:hypothetical protein